ncbi:hypothetical protein [Nocardia acidivorans]|nr:hypothetical protein [Nocardia acidivorans]
MMTTAAPSSSSRRAVARPIPLRREDLDHRFPGLLDSLLDAASRDAAH